MTKRIYILVLTAVGGVAQSLIAETMSSPSAVGLSLCSAAAYRLTLRYTAAGMQIQHQSSKWR